MASGSRRGTQEKSIVAANLASLLALKAHLNEHIAEDGLTVFAHACQLGAEGIVSKKVDGAYQSGRCRVWIKVRNPASIAVQREHGEIWNQGGSARRR